VLVILKAVLLVILNAVLFVILNEVKDLRLLVSLPLFSFCHSPQGNLLMLAFAFCRAPGAGCPIHDSFTVMGGIQQKPSSPQRITGSIHSGIDIPPQYQRISPVPINTITTPATCYAVKAEQIARGFPFYAKD